MNRPEQDRPESAGSTDARFWQAFAQAAGFDDELRELIASGEVDAFDANGDVGFAEEKLIAEDYLAADRLHELLLVARSESDAATVVELAPRRSTDKVEREPRRQYIWLAALTGVTLAATVWMAAVVAIKDDGTRTEGAGVEVASAERLAEEWFALRGEARPSDVAVATEGEFGTEAEFDAEPAVDAFDFEETPDWLVLAIVHQAELGADSVEEATP